MVLERARLWWSRWYASIVRRGQLRVGQLHSAQVLKVDRRNATAVVIDTQLHAEIKDAHRLWVQAQHDFENAQGQDEVDYAIYAMEAAEKRYEMLLRRAKRNSVQESSIIEAGQEVKLG